jgi:head-tail adaptor
MFPFSVDELSRMKEVQVDSLQDRCVIQRHGYTGNDFGEQESSWTDEAAETACGVDMRPGSEREFARNTLLQYDAVLRLAITVDVDEKDRIKVTKRYGETLSTALVFGIVSPMQRGVSGIRILLKRVEA